MSFSGSEDFNRHRDLAASYEALSRFVRSTFPLRLNRLADVEDILQETLIEAWKYSNSNPGTSPSSLNWLRTVARRKMIDCIRRCATRKRSIDSQEPMPIDFCSQVSHVPNPSARLEQCETAVVLADAMGQLSAGQRQAIRMRFFEGLTYADVANELSITPKAAQMLVRRGIAHLRRRLGRWNHCL